MELKVTRFNIKQEDDFNYFYPIVSQWWKDWNFNPLSPYRLSTNGIMIFNDNIPICAGWLFGTDSNTSIIGWLISDKRNKNKRADCINQLIEELESLAKDLGYSLVNFPAQNVCLRNKLDKKGYSEMADHNITNYFKRI